MSQVKLMVVVLAAALAGSSSCGHDKKPVATDSGVPLPPTDTCLDNDGDGYAGTGSCDGVTPLDCNDSDPNVHPQASEVCNGVDDNCDGTIDEGLPVASWYRDADGDGVGGAQKTGEGCAAPPAGSVTQSGDCNDSDPAIRPGAPELCNDVDDDCDGTRDNGLTFQDFYPDHDGDGFGDATATPLSSCQAMVMGRVPNKSDCNDHDPTVKPGAAELCNKVDDNCDGQIDNGITYQNYYPDMDGDGFGAAGSAPESSCAPVATKVTNDSDCNDLSPTAKPGAPEVCNGADDNCDGRVDENLSFANYYVDVDGDGFGSGTPVSACAPIAGRATVGGDCNDNNAAIKPGAPEVCNGVDDNCSGTIDEGLTFNLYFADLDGDGFGAGVGTSSCQSISGKVTNNTDCNDNNPQVKPGAPELCNGLDDNCNLQIDEGLTFSNYYPDSDGDGFGNKQAPAQNSCQPVTGKVTNNTDCDDTRFAIKPGATELCNGLDDNCNGATDEGLTFVNYYPDVDADGHGAAGAIAQSACSPPPNKVTSNDDCNDAVTTIHPGAPETCNGIDDNCDGLIDNGTVTANYYLDADHDGFGAANSSPIASCSPVANRVANNQDCDDGNPAIRPGATELCNGLDDNCVGGVDEGLTFLNYYPDLDSDGFGSASASPQSACTPIAGKVTDHTDCNDGNSAIKPGATEVCNGLDDNCVGGIDEGLPTQTYWLDADSDGFGAAGSSGVSSCGPVSGRVTNNTDCNDGNSAVRPNAVEVCNNVDDNCNAQVDEGNPGGGASCTTGQFGVCAPGTLTCTGGAVACARNVAPSAEKCNGLDDDCNNAVDETFADKGTSCTAGLGVCQNPGTRVCAVDGSSTVCSATAGAPTAAACDGLDNDCDGIVDEPYLSTTDNLSTLVPWGDLEVAPFYDSAGSCAGGVAGSGTDVLAGGGLAMAVGTAGLYFQRLDATGAPVGVPVAGASGLTYNDVALAQAGDGFLVAGVYAGGFNGAGDEIDLYYFDAQTGAWRAQIWSLFHTSAAIDSLRVVRGGGKRVTLIWRENGVGLHFARVEPFWSGSSWSLKLAGGGTLDTSTAPGTLVVSGTVQPGVGADSSAPDWVASQTCASAATLREVGVAYRPNSIDLKFFTMLEDGSGKSAEQLVRSAGSGYSEAEPEVGYYQVAGSNAYAVAYVEKNNTSIKCDLNLWQTNAPGYNWFYLSFASDNGVNSIARPRLSATATDLQMSAVRYVADVSGFKRQLMTRRVDFTGARLPGSSSVELSATSGGCGADPACRPGDKDGFTNWSPFGRLYYSGFGASPTGVFSSTLTCQ